MKTATKPETQEAPAGSRATMNKHEAAAYVGVSVVTLDRMRRGKRVPFTEISPKKIVYRKEDLDAFLKAKTDQGWKHTKPE